MSSIVVKTLSGDLVSIDTTMDQTLGQFKSAIVSRLRELDHHAVLAESLVSVFVDEHECQPDTEPLSTWFVDPHPDRVSDLEHDRSCMVFVRNLPDYLLFRDVIHDEKGDTQLITTDNQVRSASNHLNYVINQAPLSDGNVTDENVYFKAVIHDIAERHYTFVGLTVEKSTTFNRYIDSAYSSWSGSHHSLCVYGVSHHAALVSSNDSAARIPNQGSTTSQEVCIGYYPSNKIMKVVVVTPGQSNPYETCMKFTRPYSQRHLPEHPRPVYLIVTMTNDKSWVEFVPCSAAEQARVDAVSAFPR